MLFWILNLSYSPRKHTLHAFLQHKRKKATWSTESIEKYRYTFHLKRTHGCVMYINNQTSTREGRSQQMAEGRKFACSLNIEILNYANMFQGTNRWKLFYFVMKCQIFIDKKTFKRFSFINRIKNLHHLHFNVSFQFIFRRSPLL